jgi:enoyl-CoA hydratase/carnithine racemase/carbon monoxide dehydrogenase subunit G
MEMVGEVRLPASRQQVWDALNDPAILKASITGCESMERESGTRYATTVVSKVGPIKARFAGNVTLSDIVEPQRYTLTGEGQGGAAGFAKAVIRVQLEALEEALTLLRYRVEATVGGKLAQLGARMIDAAAAKAADEFFEQFQRAVAGAPVEEATPAAGVNAADALAVIAGTSPAPPAPATAAPPVVVAATSTAPAINPDDSVAVLVAKQIKVFISDRIAVVTLNRPAEKNAITLGMWRALPGIFDALGRNPEVRVILLTGAEENFSAGADISEFAAVRDDRAQSQAYEVAVDAAADAIADVAKPTIAVLRGYCLGGAVHLAISCDFRYAATSARIGVPSARLSIVYGMRATQRLYGLVGSSQARRLLYAGERLDAEEAARIGLIDELARVTTSHTPWWQRLFGIRSRPLGGDPMVTARDFAHRMARNAPLSIEGAKRILNGLVMGTGAADVHAIQALIARASESDDYREGRAAFFEKRDPAFQGR